MQILFKANGLHLIQLNTTVTLYNAMQVQNLQSLIAETMSDQAWVVAWLDDSVLIGRYAQNKFIFYDDKAFDYKTIKKIRIFNESKELFIWRHGQTYKGRLRTDNLEMDGEKQDIVVANQILCGTQLGNKSISHPDFTEIREDSGASLIIPFKKDQVKHINDKSQRMYVQTYNYVEKNEGYQATYADCRFVTFGFTKS